MLKITIRQLYGIVFIALLGARKDSEELQLRISKSLKSKGFPVSISKAETRNGICSFRVLSTNPPHPNIFQAVKRIIDQRQPERRKRG